MYKGISNDSIKIAFMDVVMFPGLLPMLDRGLNRVPCGCRPLLANYSYFVPYYYFWEHAEEHFKKFANVVETLWKDKNPKKSKPF
jgi:hypothetical protein